MMHWQGLIKLDGASQAPIAGLNTDPPGARVKADSPCKTLADPVDEIVTQYRALG